MIVGTWFAFHTIETTDGVQPCRRSDNQRERSYDTDDTNIVEGRNEATPEMVSRCHEA